MSNDTAFADALKAQAELFVQGDFLAQSEIDTRLVISGIPQELIRYIIDFEKVLGAVGVLPGSASMSTFIAGIRLGRAAERACWESRELERMTGDLT